MLATESMSLVKPFLVPTGCLFTRADGGVAGEEVGGQLGFHHVVEELHSYIPLTTLLARALVLRKDGELARSVFKGIASTGM